MHSVLIQNHYDIIICTSGGCDTKESVSCYEEGEITVEGYSGKIKCYNPNELCTITIDPSKTDETDETNSDESNDSSKTDETNETNETNETDETNETNPSDSDETNPTNPTNKPVDPEDPVNPTEDSLDDQDSDNCVLIKMTNLLLLSIIVIMI